MCACVQGNTTSFNPTESERGHREGLFFFFFILFFLLFFLLFFFPHVFVCM